GQLFGRQQERREEEGERRSIPIDGPVDLPYDNPVATLHPGDLFGEMTCMSLYPRSATVRALTDCTMLEMLRNVLDIIQRNKTMRSKLEDNYRRRALQNDLKNVPIFSSLSTEFIAELRDKIELVRYGAGDLIFKQGDVSAACYLVVLWFVNVAKANTGCMIFR